jgi:hypothetical protein
LSYHYARPWLRLKTKQTAGAPLFHFRERIGRIEEGEDGGQELDDGGGQGGVAKCPFGHGAASKGDKVDEERLPGQIDDDEP